MRIDPCNIDDRLKADSYFKKLMAGTKPFDITEKGKKRTLSQNALFHVWCQVLADHIGYTSIEECKYDVKKNLLGLKERVDKFSGEIVLCEYHTSEMSTAELSSFMDKMKIWAQTELGCYLPYWKDAGYDEMVKHYGNR